MSLHLPKTINFIITDFDGIITDNCVYIDSKGDISRKVNFKDIMGISLWKKSGKRLGIISGEKNSAIDLINKTFKPEEVHQNIRNKLDILKSIVSKYGLNEDEYLYIGDDVNDYDALNFVKYNITVPDAIKKIKEINNIQITVAKGGAGAFREVVDELLYN